ncbi:2-dehydro-3-deoxy-6-phosphogalactonate aldolase [Aeromonas jandaei]
MKNRELIAILRGITPQEVCDVSSVLIDAGFNKIEVPLNSPDAILSITKMKKHVGSAAIIGAGTVLTEQQVHMVFDSGGQFIVSPNCNKHVIIETLQLGLQSFPGVFTPTECLLAVDLGVTNLKLFPAHVIGPMGLKSMKAVLPEEAQIYAVGGVGPSLFKEWLSSGVHGFGIGSELYKTGVVLSEISKRAKMIVSAYDACINMKCMSEVG